MLKETWARILYWGGLLYQALTPCSEHELLALTSPHRQQYLGKWVFKAAVSFREADIQQFRALDSSVFIMEETAADTLLLTGHMRMGENCSTQTWTYRLRPENGDLEMEVLGRPQRRNLLWNGTWANCPNDCIVFQEFEPPLNKTGSVDSLTRLMLYARGDVDSGVVKAFLKNAACHNHNFSVVLPQEKGRTIKASATTVSSSSSVRDHSSLQRTYILLQLVLWRENPASNHTADTEKKSHMKSDSESTAASGMEGQSRSCQKYLLLQAWCGLLTVAMVIMAALLSSVRQKTAEDGVSTPKPDVSPTVNTFGPPLKSVGQSSSYIQLIKTNSRDGLSWDESIACSSCSLTKHGNGIQCETDGLFFIYAQVTFKPLPGNTAAAAKYVILRRSAEHKSEKTLVEGWFPKTTDSAVWVAKMVRLNVGDVLSLNITDETSNDNTFWGAYQLD